MESRHASVTNGFSIDVEDGISIAMRDRFGKRIAQTDRVRTSTQKILELLASHDTKATFFILGQVGESFPDLVRQIDAAGHEIGVHGHNHHVFHNLDQKQARRELYRGKSVLEDLTGKRIRGHRAPCFSIDESTSWVLDQLVELGFEYDSSIMPCRGFSYGWPGRSSEIGMIETPGGASIMQVPLSVTHVMGKAIPALGGSYFRLLPFTFSRRIFRKVQSQRPVIMYLHPYELDAEPYPEFYMRELSKASLKTRARMRSMWVRRKSLLARYDSLLSEFRFAPIASLLPGTPESLT
jgi:polysaccharide deacetylase family protein (PEP-CTERM system associated)